MSAPQAEGGGQAARAVRALGLGCPRCGGGLATVDGDPARLRCSYCGYECLRRSDSGVAAHVPAGRIGRRRAASAVAALLSARGVHGYAIESVQLFYLPFWELQGKLVGWQRYRVRRERPPHAPGLAAEQAPAKSELPPEDRVEEVVARDVTWSSPACDARDFGLAGIADRVATLQLRPLDLDRLRGDEIACAVVHPLSAAKRALRLYHCARVVPRGALDVRQRLDLLRAQASLIYYPIYRVSYRSAGVLHVACIDALRGRLLAGTRPLRTPDRTAAWLLAAALAGFLMGVHPALAVSGFLAWVLLRLRARGSTRGRVGLGGWLSEELGAGSAQVGELAP